MEVDIVSSLVHHSGYSGYRVNPDSEARVQGMLYCVVPASLPPTQHHIPSHTLFLPHKMTSSSVQRYFQLSNHIRYIVLIFISCGSTDGWWRRVVLQQLRHLSCVSNQDDTATISRAHQSLSKELATDNTVSVYIKPQSNSIHRLPPELIVRCFRWLVDLEPPARSEWIPCYNKNKNHRTKATLGWLKVRYSVAKHILYLIIDFR